VDREVWKGISAIKPTTNYCLILTLPFEGEEYTIHNDALKNWLGCALMHGAYASRQLNAHERNYPTYDPKLIAMGFDLKIESHYLYGFHYKIYNDHQSLKYIFT